MRITRLSILRDTFWTAGAYGAGTVIRLVRSIALTWLLAPELFGIMVIVDGLRYGIELISDVGIAQNIIYHKDADNPEFYNTAWTLQFIRGFLLFVAGIVASLPIAKIYSAPALAIIVPITAISFVLTGCTSISVFLLQKRMEIAKLNAFEFLVSFIASIVQVAIAYITPTIWALVLGLLIGTAIRTGASYFLLPDVRYGFTISKRYVWQMLHFGKWITLSSIVYFGSTSFDRLYLASAVPLGLVGVYGVARSISDMLTALVARLGNIVVFPLIASQSKVSRAELRKKLSSHRLMFLLVGAIGFAIFAVTADLAIKVLFDQRYHAAGWMLPVLLVGSWFSLLCSINESTLLGLGKPFYGALGNGTKFGCFLIGLPLGLAAYGLVGCIFVIAAADFFRYVPIFAGQVRERLSFGLQDSLITLLVFVLIMLLEWARWALGFGTSFDDFLIGRG
jgi:O-antigen/teichoic acid export membrane protein